MFLLAMNPWFAKAIILVWLSFFLPLIWLATSELAFADYPLLPVPFVAGTLCLALGLWLFHRSHADLGPNWSITLETKEHSWAAS